MLANIRQSIGTRQAGLSDASSDTLRQNVGMPRLKDQEYLRECGARLRLIREALGFKTGREFADVTGVTEDALSSWERGVNRIPDYYMRRLKDQFRVTSDYLLFGDQSGLPHSLVSALARLKSNSSRLGVSIAG